MVFVIDLIKRIYTSFQSARQKGNTLVELKTSFNPIQNFKDFPENLQDASWSLIAHYSLIFIVFVFSISIMPVPILIKFLLILILIYINFAPIFSQFFNNGLPILAWVILFFNSKFIPLSMKRPISVKVLPALETIFYGDNLSEILASKTNTFLDILCWLPYGLIHFSLPFIVAFLIFIFAPPKTLPQFCWSFGFMNLSGVIIQDLIFSCAPPWYKVLHGLENANYSMKGSPGGLGRIDKLLGIDMYTTGFTNSPLIFGAMPSLHSGCSTMDALWLTYLFPKASPIWIIYVIWLWFSTMYLTHHYFIDVVVGSCLAVVFFTLVKWRGKLPINDEFCRWDYESLKFHNIWNEDPLKQTDYDYNDFQNNDDLELQIPLSNLNSSSNETSKNSINNINNNNINNNNNNNININDKNNNSYNNINNNSFINESKNINSNKNDKIIDNSLESKLKLESEELDYFDSDDEIAEANDVEKSANKSIKKTPKTYKESFEANLSITNHPNTSSSRLPNLN